MNENSEVHDQGGRRPAAGRADPAADGAVRDGVAERAAGRAVRVREALKARRLQGFPHDAHVRLHQVRARRAQSEQGAVLLPKEHRAVVPGHEQGEHIEARTAGCVKIMLTINMILNVVIVDG